MDSEQHGGRFGQQTSSCLSQHNLPRLRDRSRHSNLKSYVSAGENHQYPSEGIDRSNKRQYGKDAFVVVESHAEIYRGLAVPEDEWCYSSSRGMAVVVSEAVYLQQTYGLKGDACAVNAQ